MRGNTRLYKKGVASLHKEALCKYAPNFAIKHVKPPEEASGRCRRTSGEVAARSGDGVQERGAVGQPVGRPDRLHERRKKKCDESTVMSRYDIITHTRAHHEKSCSFLI